MGVIGEMTESVQDYVLDVIYERKTGKLVSLVRGFLRVLSAIFSWIVQLRIRLYNIGIFSTKSLGCMIVSIGNITVGGTGKTPAVELFAKALLKEGRKVAIISRGYKSSSRFRMKRFIKKIFMLIPKDKHVKVVSDGKKIYLNSYLAGDEPYMLAKNLPGVVVVVDKDRVRAGEYVIQRYGIDTIILDDGYQHLPLNPRYDVVLVDATNPFGNNFMLPRGILREPITNLNRANLIMLTKAQKGKDYSELKNTIRQNNYNADLIECRHTSVSLVDVMDGSVKELFYLKGKKVGVISAIADPYGFENAVSDLGGNIVFTKRFQDHHRFSTKELRDILKDGNRKNITALITTEKDAVRFPKLTSTRGINVFYLQVEMEIVNGEEDFKKCVSSLCFR